MSTCYWNEKSLVRRKGAVVAVTRRGNDGSGWRDGNKEFHPHEHVSGGRRSRQIAKRHWVQKEDDSWSSGGGSSSTTTVKSPRKDEQFCRKPKFSGGTRSWLMKADGRLHTG